MIEEWWPIVGERVVLDGDPDEHGEVVADAMGGVVIRWDGGDYTEIAPNELWPELAAKSGVKVERELTG